MDILEKIIEFLTANPFISEEEAENRQLNAELNKRIKKIKRLNKIKIIETSIKPFLQAEYFKHTNMLMTEEDLCKSAEWEFENAKRLGFIDDLNSLRIRE